MKTRTTSSALLTFPNSSSLSPPAENRANWASNHPSSSTLAYRQSLASNTNTSKKTYLYCKFLSLKYTTAELGKWDTFFQNEMKGLYSNHHNKVNTKTPFLSAAPPSSVKVFTNEPRGSATHTFYFCNVCS